MKNSLSRFDFVRDDASAIHLLLARRLKVTRTQQFKSGCATFLTLSLLSPLSKFTMAQSEEIKCYVNRRVVTFCNETLKAAKIETICRPGTFSFQISFLTVDIWRVRRTRQTHQDQGGAAFVHLSVFEIVVLAATGTSLAGSEGERRVKQ